MKKHIIFLLFLCAAFLSNGCKHYDSDIELGDIPLGVSARYTENYIQIYPSSQNTAPKRKTGVLFYPGGAVAPDAYAKMLAGLSLQGYTVCIVKMPLDLAVLDAKKGLKYLDTFSGVEQWIIVGHSLGGAMAGDVVKSDGDKFKGIVFLAAYPNQSISAVSIAARSIYGSNDGVADLDKVKDSSKLPDGTQFVAIEGGNHAQFGSYGAQAGDGTPTISESEQHMRTQTAILDFLNTL